MNCELQKTSLSIPTQVIVQTPVILGADTKLNLTQFNAPVANVHQYIYQNTRYRGLVNGMVIPSKELYNLFVVEGQDLNELSITIPSDCVLQTNFGTERELVERFISLTNDGIEEIKTFPSLFASTNKYGGATDDAHQAILGLVTNIEIVGGAVKIDFQGYVAVPQQTLNNMQESLRFAWAAMRNELNHVHWAIKRVDLIEVLRPAIPNIPPLFSQAH